MDTNQRLRRLLDERGWTEYKLSKVCGLSQSTLANIFKRNTVPSITTLEVICKGFGITLSQFFADGEMVEPSGFLFFCPQYRYIERLLSFSITPKSDFPV